MFITYPDFIRAYPKFKNLVKTEADFLEINKNCSQLISDVTGFPVPKEAHEAPRWARVPALYICYRYTLQQSATKTDAEITESINLYNEAMKLLNQHIFKDGIKASSGRISEKFEW